MPAIGIAGLIFASHALIYQTLLQFLPLFLVEGWGKVTLAAIIGGCFCVLNFGGNIVAGRLLDKKISPFLILSVTYFMVGVFIILVTLQQALFAALLCLFLSIGFLTGAAPSILFYLVSKRAPETKQIPVFMAWMLQIQGLSILIGPSVVSWSVDMSQSWIVASILLQEFVF